MALLGAIAVASTAMLNSRDVVGSIGAKQESRLLVQALRLARNTAVASGQNVTFQAIRNGRDVTGFRIFSDAAGSRIQPDQLHPESVVASWNAPSVVFRPDGSADLALAIKLSGSASTTWLIEVYTASGQVVLTQH